MLLLVALARASTSDASFAADAGDWEGGSVEEGVLRLDDTSAVLNVGEVTSFVFTARMRLAAGEGFTVRLGDACTFTAEYTGAEEIGFGGSSQPFPVAELAFLPGSSPVLNGSGADETGGVGDPEVVYFNGTWWMFYTAFDTSLGPSVHAATSTDLTNWTRSSATVLAGASQPSAEVVAGELVLLYGSGGQLWRTSSPDGLSFSFPTVALSPGTGFDASGLGHPSVLAEEGAWRLWYSVPATGASGSATSSDGTVFTRDAELSVDNGRLFGVDVEVAALGFEGVYTLLDSIGFAVGGEDPHFADAGTDLRPLLSMNDTAWSEGGFGTAGMVRDGNALTLFVDASHENTQVIGQVTSSPLPGTFATLTVNWDGAQAEASWGGGPVMTCAMTEFVEITVTANGLAELDETSLTFEGTGTGDTGDTAEPVDSGTDTAAGDDSGAGVIDTGPTGLNAGEWLGEPGGCGCSSAPARHALPLVLLPLLLQVARRRTARPA